MPRARRDDSGERVGWWIGDHFLTDEDMARLREAKRRVSRARKFPINTCPASRHLHIIADALARGEDYPMLREEPQHVAESIYAVLAHLWELRTKSPEYRAEVERLLRGVA